MTSCSKTIPKGLVAYSGVPGLLLNNRNTGHLSQIRSLHVVAANLPI